MPDPTIKWPQNVAGVFFVDQQCLDCDLCRQTAPNNFSRQDDGGYSYVNKQPETSEELEQCIQCVEGCCTEAIGHDLKYVATLPPELAESFDVLRREAEAREHARLAKKANQAPAPSSGFKSWLRRFFNN
jgi:ferredoxin